MLASEKFKQITTKNTDSKSTFDSPEEKIPKEYILTIPAGTRVLPLGRHNNGGAIIAGHFYITLDEDIKMEIADIRTVSINGMYHNILPYNTNDADYSASSELRNTRVNNSEFVIKAGTKYYINDPVKDPIGLSHKFEVEQYIVLEHGSEIRLAKNARTVINDINYVVPSSPSCVFHCAKPNDLYSITQNDIKCII